MPDERELSRPWIAPALAWTAPAALACMLACAADSGVGQARSEVLLVSAASSLKGAFGAVELAFESIHPGVDVELNLGASSVLREQILGGAPVDVFASADSANMDLLAQAGLVAGAPRIFARNRLRIAVPTGNPASVAGLEDFADKEIWVGLCSAQAPCGAYGDRLLAAAGVSPSVDTREPSALALLAKIEAGELDAGIVYATDVASSTGVEGIAVPGGEDVLAAYVLASIAGARSPRAATAFIEFVLSDPGRAILAQHGFLAP